MESQADEATEGTSEDPSVGECLVLMPISDPRGDWWPRYDSGHFRAVYDDLFEPAIKACDLRAVYPQVDHGVILTELGARIRDARHVLCDLSTFNPNVLIELGLRGAVARSMTVVVDDITNSDAHRDLPFDLRGQAIHTYRARPRPAELAGERMRLAELISRGMADESNPISDAFGVHAERPQDRISLRQDVVETRKLVEKLNKRLDDDRRRRIARKRAELQRRLQRLEPTWTVEQFDWTDDGLLVRVAAADPDAALVSVQQALLDTVVRVEVVAPRDEMDDVEDGEDGVDLIEGDDLD